MDKLIFHAAYLMMHTAPMQMKFPFGTLSIEVVSLTFFHSVHFTHIWPSTFKDGTFRDGSQSTSPTDEGFASPKPPQQLWDNYRTKQSCLYISPD
jgi:hypothetical protein